MRVSRSSHGLWWQSATRTILVFGGRSYAGFGVHEGSRIHIDLRTCEQLQNGHWLALPSMNNPRSGFHPCAYQQTLYLCGYSSNSVEGFSLVDYSFFPLQIRLPEENTQCCLLIQDSHLIILTCKYAVRCDIGPNHQLTLAATASHSPCLTGSRTPPVVDSINGLVYICRGDTCFSVKLDGRDSRVIGK